MAFVIWKGNLPTHIFTTPKFNTYTFVRNNPTVVVDEDDLAYFKRENGWVVQEDSESKEEIVPEPEPELTIVDRQLKGTTSVTLGYGLRRLTLLVDRIGRGRRALWLERPADAEEQRSFAFSKEALLDDGDLWPLVNPPAIARQLGLDPD